MQDMKIDRKKTVVIAPAVLAILAISAFAGSVASAAEKKKETAPSSDAEKVNVDIIKEKYWAKGEESELGVVQNRQYSKSKKFQLGLFGGFVTSDPFLSTKALGLSLAYHLSEYVGVGLVYWKDFVSASTALQTFEESRGATANTNKPRYTIGAEALFSMIYGKLSLLGKAIIYYDLHLTAGGGITNTESGTYVSPHIGIGQRFYLTEKWSLRLDYRMLYYNEKILEKEIPTKLGQEVGSRGNFNNVITLGFDFLLFFK